MVGRQTLVHVRGTSQAVEVPGYSASFEEPRSGSAVCAVFSSVSAQAHSAVLQCTYRPEDHVVDDRCSSEAPGGGLLLGLPRTTGKPGVRGTPDPGSQTPVYRGLVGFY